MLLYHGHEQRVVFGSDVAQSATATEFDRLGARRVLVITGDSEVSLAKKVAVDLPVTAMFSGVLPHVPLEVAQQARATAREGRADAVLSVGGGSAIGTAKAVVLTERLPIVAVPTTYAGSEATDVWGLTEGNRKTTGADPIVLPRSVVYDADLTVTLDRRLTVSSGLNALAHCIDSLWAPQVNPVSTALATEGIRVLAEALPAVLTDGGDLVARGRCQQGTYLAATAFSGAGSGLHHKICHVLGGAYNLEHAATHAVVLPHVLGFNAPAAPEAADRIARALAAAGFGDGRDALTALLALYKRLDAPSSLEVLGLGAHRVGEAAALAEEKVPPTNPRPVTRADLDEIIGRAQAGRTAIVVPLDQKGGTNL